MAKVDSCRCFSLKSLKFRLKKGFSSVHLASMFGHVDILAYLIAKGQDIDLLDKHGMTPLMHAALRIKQRDPTQLLIR